MSPILNVVLVEPEIPQNTGNVSRTCAATGTSLHLVRPLGFSLEDRYLRRAGLDYWEHLDLRVHDSWAEFVRGSGCPLHGEQGAPPVYFCTRKATSIYSEVPYPEGTWIVFGRESTGLPDEILDRYREACVRIPVRSSIRSLNLSNAVAIVVYEALRTRSFHGLSLAP